MGLAGREVDQEYFATRTIGRAYSPKLLEFRQFPIPHTATNFKGEVETRTYTASVTLRYFHDGTGDAIYHDYWAKQMRFFVFGCDHAYMAIPQTIPGRCIHSSRCTKCGDVRTVDSSD